MLSYPFKGVYKFVDFSKMFDCTLCSIATQKMQSYAINVTPHLSIYHATHWNLYFLFTFLTNIFNIWLCLNYIYGGCQPGFLFAYLWFCYISYGSVILIHGPAHVFHQYLESVRPLLDSKHYNQMEILANDFKDSIATQLQRYLILKSWWATNYVSRVYE